MRFIQIFVVAFFAAFSGCEANKVNIAQDAGPASMGNTVRDQTFPRLTQPGVTASELDTYTYIVDVSTGKHTLFCKSVNTRGSLQHADPVTSVVDCKDPQGGARKRYFLHRVSLIISESELQTNPIN